LLSNLTTSPGDWQMLKDWSLGIIQRLQNEVSLCFGDFYRKTEEVQKFETLLSSGTNQIPLQIQAAVTEL
jgi:hypothetical protein